jgi:hypothetical protein
VFFGLIYIPEQLPEILNKVFSRVSGSGSDQKGQEAHAQDVFKWYNRFYSKYPFVIALQAKERFPPSPYSEIGPAARDSFWLSSAH